jgi:hypothetical protein
MPLRNWNPQKPRASATSASSPILTSLLSLNIVIGSDCDGIEPKKGFGDFKAAQW